MRKPKPDSQKPQTYTVRSTGQTPTSIADEFDGVTASQIREVV